MESANLKTVYKHCLKCGTEMVPEGNFVKCGSCGFAHYINNFPSIKGIILNERNEVLVGKRVKAPETGLYDLPGGFTDPGETLEDTVIRELKEEVNLDINKDDITYYTSFYQDYALQELFYPVLVAVFVVKPKSFANIKGGDDIGEISFFKLKDVDMKKMAFDGQRKMFQEYLRINLK